MACLSHAEWMAFKKKPASEYLSTVFLANRSRVNPNSRTLAYSPTLGVRVPDYEIDNRLWLNGHYEGGYLFRDAVILKLVPPDTPEQLWQITSAWQGTGVNLTPQEVPAKTIRGGKVEVKVQLPSEGKTQPGIEGQLRFVVSAWNPDAADD